MIVIVLLFGTLLNDYVPPAIFAWFNLLSLAFPILMIINFFLCLFWLILWQKRALVFGLMTLMLFTPVRRWINYSRQSDVKPNLKVISMNIHSGKMGREKLYDYFKNSGADIILSQEYGNEFNVPGYPYKTNDYGIVALNSKTKIINQKKLETSDTGTAFYADIQVENKIIRVVNVYLNPFFFNKEKVKPVENYTENKAKFKQILKKLIPTFKIHQDEITEIRKAIDDSPYPVILAGDFNSVPNSYEYYTLGRGLTDAFVEVGRGSSTTFHDYKFPIRIDYIFASPELRPINYRVDRTVKLSDHYPVIAEFKID